MDQALDPHKDFRKEILHSLENLFGYSLSNFWIVDESHNLLEPVTHNISQLAMKEYNEYYYKIDILRSQKALPFFQKQLVVQNDDLFSKTEYENNRFYRDFMVRYEYYSEMAVCIKWENKILGNLTFLRTKDEGPFNHQDRMCLEIISRYLSLKFKNYLEFKKTTEKISLATDREKEVLILVQKGYTNEEIGNLLFISTNTVKKHLHSLYRKLDVPNRTSLGYKTITFNNNS